MALDTIKMEWTDDFSGTMESPLSTIRVGSSEGEMKPYHLLFGALGSCFYSTFINVAKKKRLTFGGASLQIDGVMRTEAPKTLETVSMLLTIKKPSDRQQFLRCVDYGIEFCSIHKTISAIATIKTEVVFED